MNIKIFLITPLDYLMTSKRSRTEISLETKYNITFFTIKVALILDFCRAYYININLTNVELFYLPPNTTSKTQPLDEEIINLMKCNYIKRLIHKLYWML